MISKYLKVVCLFNAIPNFNAVRSNDADRLEDETTTADLSACEAPDNVGLKAPEKSDYMSTSKK